MKNIRVWHSYFGFFIAPSVIFFALTGALQLFGFHEARGAYEPPPLLEKLGRLHKDQEFVVHERQAPKPPEAAGPPKPHDEEPAPPVGTMMLKWYCLLVALCLTTSTVLGLWIGLTHLRHKRVGWALLIAGTMLPLSLTLL